MPHRASVRRVTLPAKRVASWYPPATARTAANGPSHDGGSFAPHRRNADCVRQLVDEHVDIVGIDEDKIIVVTERHSLLSDHQRIEFIEINGNGGLSADDYVRAVPIEAFRIGSGRYWGCQRFRFGWLICW